MIAKQVPLRVRPASSDTFGINCESSTNSVDFSSIISTSITRSTSVATGSALYNTTGCLQKTCLHPKLSLKYQLFLAFELVAIFSLLFVTFTGSLVAFEAGGRVKETSRSTMETWSEEKFVISARVIAETTTKRLSYLEGVSAIMRETTQDRFAGYPNHPGYSNDSLVPFRDSVSGQNTYPLKAKELIPYYWEAEATDLDAEDAKELFGDRASWYWGASMKLPTFQIQTKCDPERTFDVFDEYTITNNLTCSTPTLRDIHAKVSDYAPPVLKSLYEIHSTFKSLGIYFVNSGHGAHVAYPGSTGTRWGDYISEGCDWMRQPNPMDPSMPIGNEETIAACNPAGKEVSYANENPLERHWCRDQALSPDKYPFSIEPYRVKGQWLMGIGTSIYDRVTNEFIACSGAEVSLESIAKLIRKVRLTDTSRIALVRWDERGTVFSSEEWDPFTAETPVTVSNLSLGVTDEFYASLKQRFVDAYDENYNRTAFEKTIRVGGKVLTTFPVPVPPNTYDPNYVPTFMIILSVEESEIFSEVDNVFEAVDESVSHLMRVILIAGLTGFLTVTFCTVVISLYLTKPMEWMSIVGDQIVNDIGSSVKDDILSHESSLWMRFSPRTEIFQLYQQFQLMVKKFAGQGTAKLQFQRSVEAKNPFSLQGTFQGLYEKYAASQMRYLEGGYELPEMHASSSLEKVNYSKGRTHWGPNHQPMSGDESLAFTAQGDEVLSEIERKKMCSSRLFWWIFSFIALPLLITMIAISGFVTWNLIVVFPDLVRKVEGVFVNFEARSLTLLASARADFAETIVAISVQDLHLMARIAGWVMFGGLQQSSSFTEMGTGIEQCKTFPKEGNACPYYDKFKTPCDCKWPTARQDESADQCYNYELDPREFQKAWWIGRKQDAWPNGDVNFTTYPGVAFSPETTEWWDDQLTVPGHEEGLNSTGLDTTYKVLHALSSVSMIEIPIVRYQGKVSGDTRGTGGVMVAMEESGVMSGYLGCDQTHAKFAHYQSDGKMNPELCPKGQFGYDPRCTHWYVLGKQHHLENGNAYLTPPFLFPQTNRVLQMFNAPLIDPKTGSYVGMAGIQFDGKSIFDSISQEMTPLPADGFHVMVSAVRDSIGTDTVVAPGFSFESLKEDRSAPIEKFIQKNDFQQCAAGVDGNGCKNIEEFRSNVLEKMQAGMQDTASFARTNDAGEAEDVTWAYAPVKFRSLKPVDHSDFNAGVEEVERVVFSVAFAHSNTSLHSTFDDTEEDMNRGVMIAIALFAASIGVAFLVVTYFTMRVTTSIIHSVNDLLVLVTGINRETEAAREEIAEVQGGSKEVIHVHKTFEKLHTTMRFANVSFFSGDLVAAYDTLSQALAVFTKLKNDKAIGVAHNNLGNIMLTMYRTMKETQAPMIAGLTKAEVVAKGIKHFKKAIDTGEVAIEDINQLEGWSNNYLVFMQQLSNRYFNRAMFLLTTKEDHPNPIEAENQGKMDLGTSEDMDREVVNNGDKHGFKGDENVYFDLLLTRVRGIMNLMDMGYEVDWELDELFDEARSALNTALRVPDTTMFQSMQPAGQMQLLDAEMIRYFTREGKKEKAAMIAIRMLSEDEYVIGDAGLLAVKALIDYLPDANLNEDRSDVSSSLFQCRRVISDTLSLTQEINQQDDEPAAPETTRSLRTTARRSTLRNVRNTCLKQSNIGDLSMEFF